mmetsp:Transcript_25722/g.51484  ORF Transcript_25722/g.51484 Transcript_25722/m.51484 type:complete len:285 (+) Transcript_25722:145-999(+)
MPRLLLRILSSSSFDSQRFVRAKYSTPPPRGSRLGRERRSHRGFRIVFHFFDRAACLGSRSSGDGNDGKDSELFVAFVASAILENRQGIGTSRVAFPSQSSQEGERDEQRQRSSIIISSNHNHNHNHDFLTCSSSTIDTTNVPFAIPSHLHVHANPSKTPFSWSSDSLLLHRSPDDIPTALSVEPETPVPRRDRILHPLPFGIILAALVATTSRTANGGDVRLVVVLLVSTELLRTGHVVVGMGRGAGAMFLLHSLRRRERDGWGLDDVVSSGLSLLRRHRLSE